MRFLKWLAAPLALILVSCGGGGGTTSGGNSGIPGPTNLRVIAGSTPDQFSLTWTPPANPVDGYNLEVQMGSEGFKIMNDGLILPQYTTLYFSFNNTAPEETNFTFRVNAQTGNVATAYSNSATVRHGLNAPDHVSGQYDWDRSGVSLSWSRNTAVGDGLLIERANSDSSGYPSGAWTPLTVSEPLASAYLDASASLGSYYVYRITNRKGGSSSVPGMTTSPIYAGLPAPGQPTAAFDGAASGIRVTWSKNTTYNTGVKIERTETTSYGSATGSWTQLTLSDPTANTFLDTTAPLNAYYAYRVSNLKGESSSLPSAASYSVYAGVQPPYYVNAYWNSTLDGVQVSWTCPSGGPYAALIERGECDASGNPTGSWSSVATVSEATSSYLDQTVPELILYRYRVSLRLGTTTSLPISSYTVSVPLARPTNLSVVAEEGGARLTWINRSAAASQLVVRRYVGSYDYSDVAILSATTETYLDVLPNLGYYSYAIVAKNGYNYAESVAATFTTPNPADALKFTSVNRTYPDAASAAITPGGTWALTTSSPFGVISNNDPWGPYFPNDSLRNVLNPVQVDVHGHPHLVYLLSNPQNNQEAILRHAWHDGTAWKMEDMGKTQLTYLWNGAGYTFALDSLGTPHALLEQAPNGGTTNVLSYIHKVNEAWVQDSFSTLTPAISFTKYALRLDAADKPHVIFYSPGSLYACMRDAENNWISETVLTGSISFDSTYLLDGTWVDTDNATLMYVNYVYSGRSTYQVMAIRKVNGAWQSPVCVMEADNGTSSAQFVVSPDRSRMLLLIDTRSGLRSYHRDENGWHPTLVANLRLMGYPWYQVGFDGSNKVHVLVKNGYLTGQYTEFHE